MVCTFTHMSYLSVADAASQCGRSVSGIHKLIDAGRLTPKFRAPGIRGALFFSAGDVTRLADELAAEASA